MLRQLCLFGGTQSSVAVPLIGSIQSPGPLQGQPNEQLHRHGRHYHARKHSHASYKGDSREKPQPNLSPGGTQGHHHIHGLLLSSHEEEGEQAQYRQCPYQGGKGDSLGSGLHGL